MPALLGFLINMNKKSVLTTVGALKYSKSSVEIYALIKYSLMYNGSHSFFVFFTGRMGYSTGTTPAAAAFFRFWRRSALSFSVLLKYFTHVQQDRKAMVTTTIKIILVSRVAGIKPKKYLFLFSSLSRYSLIFFFFSSFRSRV